MNKNWKIFWLSVLGVAIIAYLSFLFIIPNVLNVNSLKPEIQKIAKEQANLGVDFENAKVITTPLLGVGIKAENICVKLPDNSILFSADNFKTRISIPSLFLLTVKISCLEINNPFINLEIINDEQFKLIQLVENILNAGKEQKLEQVGTEEPAKSWFNPAWIRIKVPNVVVNNYNVLINDLKSNHYLRLSGEKLSAGYFNGKAVKVKTYAELFSDENKNITANININTFLPPPAPALDEEDDPAERIDIPFVNPVTMYRNYDLKANVDTKLKVRSNRSGVFSYGYCNIDDITLKVAHLILPASYFHIKTFGRTVELDTNIYPAKEQNVALLGKLEYGSHPKLDMYIKTAQIKFNDMLILGKAFLDSLHIYNELGTIVADGSIQADCYIKTNFKKLRSSGAVIIKDGGLAVKNIGQVLRDANINIVLDNNILDIQNSNLYVHNSPVLIDGRIDKKSVADISIKADKVPLPVLFNAFAPKDVRKVYNFKSGDASLELCINGKLKKAVATMKAGLDNLYFADKASNFIIKDEKFASEFYANSKEIKGDIKNNNFAIELPKTKSVIKAPATEIQIADKNIFIKENELKFNDNSTINYSGAIINYEKLKNINFVVNGDVSTNDLVKVIGYEFKQFIHSQGSIPVKLMLKGDAKKQTLFVQALANKNNFITPIDYEELKDKDVTLQSTVDFKANRIKIKNTGLSIRNIDVDEKGKEVVSYEIISDVDGTIEGNRINLIKIIIPKTMHGKIYAFPNSSYKFSGKAYVFGELASPRMRGGFTLTNLSIPELLMDLRKGELKFRGHEADLTVEDLILNGSDVQSKMTMSLIPYSVLNILNLEASSRYFNLDKVMKVTDKAMKYVPMSQSSSSVNSQPADIPVEIKNGSINMTRIMTGNIDVRNTTGRISMDKNIFNIHNLKTNVFNGKVSGDIAVDLIKTIVDVDVKGKGVDVEKAMLDAAGMKDILNGTADFNADISLQGATYEEQMKSLKGKVDFTVKDGQFGPFGKIENLIIAENIRESKFFQTALGGIISGLTTIDTTHFSELNGSLSFENGICHIEPITSLGNILSLHIFGDFDLLRNYADMKVRARMASLISNLLGPLGAINPANLISNAASLNIVTAKAFSIFCEMLPAEELAVLPSFANAYVDNAATKFQLVVRGDVAKPFTLIKSFKWLATETEYENAVDYVNSLPEQLEGSTAVTIEELIAENEAYKKTLRYKFKHLFEDETNNVKTLAPQEGNETNAQE